MYRFYENLPFSVLILKGEPLKVCYVNNRFIKSFNISLNSIGVELSKLSLPEGLVEVINNYKSNTEEQYIRNIKLDCDTLGDINIIRNKDIIEIFIKEIKKKNLTNLDEDNNMKDDIIKSNIIESFPYFLCVSDKNGNIKYINKKSNNYFKNFKFKSFKNIYDYLETLSMEDTAGNEITLHKFPVYESINYGKCIIDKVMLCKYNDLDKYITVTSFPIYDEYEIIGGICVAIDITEYYDKMLKERHEREKFLYLSTELKTKCDIIEILRRREKEHLMHLKDVINNISEGIIAIDGNMKVTLCNKSVQQIIGLKQLELMDYNNILKRYHIESEDGKNLKYYYYNYCKKNLPVKNLILKFKNNINGEIKYIEFSSNPIINSNGELIYTIITLKDITDKKLNQIYTKNQSEFIKNVLNTLDIPIAVLDYPGFKNRVLNNKFQQILNSLFHGEYNMEDIEGKNVCEVFSKYINNDFFKSLIYSVESNKEIILPPFSLKEPGKREKYYKMRITPYKAENGEIRIYIHGVDVTEEVNRSMELERISRMKDEFFTIISHELRTPLTIIYSSLQLAYDIYKDEITANINKTLDRIKQNCSRLLKLTNNIMDISKAEEGLLSINNVEFDLVIESERIVNLVNLYGRKKGLDIIFDTNEEECKVIIDREKYERILLNLLSNAIKYTPESKNIYVLLDVKEEYFILTIKDEGVGIPDKDKEFIFNRYSQIDSTLSRRAEGVGLGLTVVKKFVEAMEGKIFVKSKQGEGSEFSVVFDRYSKVKSTELSLTTLRETFRDIISIEMSDIN